MIQVGEMDQLITIRRWSSVRDSAGGLQEVNTSSWQVWAKIENKKGRALTDNDQMTWSYGYVMTMYYDSSRPIFSNDTVDYDGQRLRINSTSFMTEGNRSLVQLGMSTTGNAIVDTLSTMIDTIQYTGLGGEDHYTQAALIGKVYKIAFKDGTEFKIIDYPALLDDTQKQVTINPATGQTLWTVPFGLSENAMIVYADL